MNKMHNKVISAYKGLINSYTLESGKISFSDTVPGYKRTWKMFSSDQDNEMLELMFESRSLERLVSLLHLLYPDKLDEVRILALLKDSLTTWIEHGHDPNDQNLVEGFANELIENISKEILELEIYIPILGLKLKGIDAIVINGCTLLDKNTKLVDLQSPHELMLEKLEGKVNISAGDVYVKTIEVGHTKTAIAQAKNRAHDVLDIIRLYIGSHYYQIYSRKTPYRMGVAGSFQERANTYLFVRDKNQAGKTSPLSYTFELSRMDLPIWEINQESLKYFRELGWEKISKYHNLDGNSEYGRRLTLAIKWFAKATEADNAKDSLLMYAIAIESLFSQGRTSQISYAKQMEFLFSFMHDNLKLGGFPISKTFKTILESNRDSYRNEAVIRKGEVLFNKRNKIVHGGMVEVQPMELLDFESLTRISILAYACGNWNTHKKYKAWAKKQNQTQATLVQRIIILLRRIIGLRDRTTS